MRKEGRGTQTIEPWFQDNGLPPDSKITRKEVSHQGGWLKNGITTATKKTEAEREVREAEGRKRKCQLDSNGSQGHSEGNLGNKEVVTT